MSPKKKYTVAVDFDGVLHSYATPWQSAGVIPDPPVAGAIEWLSRLIQDFEVVIFSTRAKWWTGRRAMRRWLKLHAGNLWNESMGYRGLEDVTFSATKSAALVYVDDRAWRFDGKHFPSTREIHQARPWNKPKSQTPSGHMYYCNFGIPAEDCGFGDDPSICICGAATSAGQFGEAS